MAVIFSKECLAGLILRGYFFSFGSLGGHMPWIIYVLLDRCCVYRANIQCSESVCVCCLFVLKLLDVGLVCNSLPDVFMWDSSKLA